MSVVRFEKHDTLGHIILDDPPFNWIGDALRHDLRQAIHDASEAGIRALLIHAVGPNFSTGGAVHDWVGKSPHWMSTFMADMVAAYRTLGNLQIPVVAAVRGAAFGGGLELALACDFIVASQTAVLWSLEIVAGIVPLGGGVQRLVRLIGQAKAMRIVMLGEKTPIAAVPDVADYIVADPELDGFAVDFATRLSNGPTKAYAATKALLKAHSIGGVEAADRLMEDLTAHLFQTRDVGAAMMGLVPVYARLTAPGSGATTEDLMLPQAAFVGA